MKRLSPYLIFPGTCEDALGFYKECLQGEFTVMQTFADSPIDVPGEYKQKIMNSAFRAGDISFMASDCLPGDEVPIGRNFALLIHFSESEEQEKVFNKLLEGGKVIMPLEDSFGGARFGMLVDKYGIQWMLGVSHE
jgi:PhnB protein